MTCFLLVEDHPLLADALRTQLQSLFSPFECVVAATLAQGLQLYSQRQNVDLVILDLNLPDSQDAATLQAFCEVRHAGPMLVFSSAQNPELIELCASNRVSWVPKSAAISHFKSAVLEALTDRTQSLVRENSIPCVQSVCDEITRLSCQQKLVLSQMARGKSCAELAKQMHISECTVRSHMHAIYRKLGVKNKSQACSLYWKWVNSQGEPITVG